MIKRITVLIETLWNVNVFALPAPYLMDLVLIETLWNVNLERMGGSGTYHTGINRNIVECKSYTAALLSSTSSIVLIETLWNVNIFAEAIEELKDLVLIETLWNVNTGGTVGAISLAIGINRNIVECK